MILHILYRGLPIEMEVGNRDTQLFRDHLKGFSMNRKTVKKILVNLTNKEGMLTNKDLDDMA